jgi:poly(A) polymerase
MLDRDILKPVLPEIESKRVANLEALIGAEAEAGIGPEPLRRLAALLPRDATLAEDVASRLRFSNKAKKRLACSVVGDLGSSPQTLAYRLGNDCAVDRLLLAGRTADAAAIASWKAPRLPVGGGTLIDRGLPEGPIVAHTLKSIERRWVEAGFPAGEELEEIVSDELRNAR